MGDPLEREAMMQEYKDRVIRRIQALGIEELRHVTALDILDGNFINLDCVLPNGDTAKILNDDKQYLACQVERTKSDRCYGVAADEKQIAVYEYDCNGTDAVLVLWARL